MYTATLLQLQRWWHCSELAPKGHAWTTVVGRGTLNSFSDGCFSPHLWMLQKADWLRLFHVKLWVRDHWVWLSELPRFNKIGVLRWNCLQVEGVCPTALSPSWPGLSVWPRSGGRETRHQLIPKSGTAESGGTQPHLARTWRHVNVMVWSVI